MRNYIVFDLEWNQGEAPVQKDGKTLNFEIVEIGAVKLNNKKEKIGEFSRLIKPQIHRQISKIFEPTPTSTGILLAMTF